MNPKKGENWTLGDKVKCVRNMFLGDNHIMTGKGMKPNVNVDIGIKMFMIKSCQRPPEEYHGNAYFVI